MLEFKLRARVQSPVELVQSTTLVNAEIVQMTDELGVLEEGALADLLIVDGNPCEDINVLLEPSRLLGIIEDGDLVRYDF